MLQELVNNCLTCIKRAEASYSGLLWMRVYYHTAKRGPFCFGIWKNKSQLIAWKIIPEAYCRQHLLKMQVKLNTYHWGIQWNSLVMQVKKAAIQRMGSGGKGRTENRGHVSRTACIFYFYGKYIKKSQRLTVRATTDLFLVTAEHCAVILAERTPRIAAEESIKIATTLYLFQFRSAGILCRVCRTTWRHTKIP